MSPVSALGRRVTVLPSTRRLVLTLPSISSLKIQAKLELIGKLEHFIQHSSVNCWRASITLGLITISTLMRSYSIYPISSSLFYFLYHTIISDNPLYLYKCIQFESNYLELSELSDQINLNCWQICWVILLNKSSIQERAGYCQWENESQLWMESFSLQYKHSQKSTS